MKNSHVDARLLAENAIAALRRGDANDARTSFEKIVEAGQADASAYLGLAIARRFLGDHTAALTAIDAALGLEPRSVPALIFKADHFRAAGDDRAAASYYQAVLKCAPAEKLMAVELQNEVARARSMVEHYVRQIESKFADTIAKAGLTDNAQSSRFTQSLDILSGKKTVHFQNPRYYYFPELPQIQFYAPSTFPWLADLESATADIRQELEQILRDDSSFTPYVQSDPKRPALTRNGMVDNPAWSAFFLYKDGEVVDANAARCPKTMAAMSKVPLASVPGRSPSVLFSLLRPGAKIPPHHGWFNTRLIVHLPLIVPSGCGFRVGNDTREWVEGKAWVFDDTMEHEAWNLSSETRVILLFEIWRPELTDDERTLVSALLKTVGDHQSGEDWSI